jgi:hypothetical protein
MAFDSSSIENLLALIEQDQAELIVEFLEDFGIIVDLEELSGVIGDIEEVATILAEAVYGPASPEELEQLAIRLLVEAVTPGRDLIIEPVVNIPTDEEVVLNGTIVTPLLINDGAIVDAGGRLGDNLFTGVLFNDGEIAFDRGQDLIVSLAGGLANTGTISTGDRLDLVSGTDSGVESVKGIFNLGIPETQDFGVGGVIETGAGDDRVIGNAIGIIDAVGIANSGPEALIATGRNNDLVFGNASAINLALGIENEDGAIISTGLGDDWIIGEADDLTGLVPFGAMAGILNDAGSLIQTGSGDDAVEGFAFAGTEDGGDSPGDVAGIANEFSTINLNSGNDFLLGEAFALNNQTVDGIISRGTTEERAVINLGRGDDTVLGFAESDGGFITDGIDLRSSTIISSTGNNFIEGEAIGGIINHGIFLDSDSLIKLGSGNDFVGGFAFDGEFNTGITNFGRISLGAGDDLIDAAFGGFGGNGTTKLGRGNDRVLGFGSGFFRGGLGTDIIALGEGTYVFDSSTNTLTSGDTTMNLRSFEGITGLADLQTLLLTDGTYVVDSNDNIQFV